MIAALRRQQAERLLSSAGWSDAGRTPLAGDASARRYDRLSGAGGQAVLMDAPPRSGDDPADFVTIGRHLNALGLSAPKVLAQDLPQGFLLLEDLGDDLYARILTQAPEREAELYAAATDVLIRVQGAPAPKGLPDLSAADWAEAVRPAFDWYGRCAGAGDEAEPTIAALTAALTLHADGPRVLILRDYHAENLLWLPDRNGVARVGLLDFQLGQMGQRGYDLVSLLQDARRDVSPATEEAMIRRFDPSEAFRAQYAVLGAQRNLRILGIFARLAVMGKPSYLPLIPRVWAHLRRNMAHPALAGVPLDLPAPTPDLLDRIARCRP
ncbi:aminoglycoside phosphotransferase family protein [Falsirhodobacter sp. 20TX0035]|uniref:aminoglycoside phosphotransferase family protein n=1 Tax=Falsirhodobacter sp. 20TX0035 TaxID=3022019 RepID=UPI003FA58A99